MKIAVQNECQSNLRDVAVSCNFFPFLRYVLLHIFVQMLVLGKLINKYVNKTQSMNFFEDRYFKKF